MMIVNVGVDDAPDRGGSVMSLHNDLLAELELTMVPTLRFRPEPGMYVPAGERPGAAARSGSRHRSFWCALKEQRVDVEFETRTFLGFPRPVGIKRCSVFGDPEKVACGRHCLDAKFRRQWPPALPIADSGRARRD
jgi:hypothetical protein